MTAKESVMFVCVQGHCDFDFMIMMDGSGSIGEANWLLMQSAVGTLLDVIDSNSKLGETSRVGIIQFSHTQNHSRIIEVELSENKTRAEIDTSTFVWHAGGTHPYYHLLLAISTLKNNTRFVGGSRITATQGIILFTDGQFSGPGARDILPTMLGLMDEGIHITLIGKSYPNNTTCTVVVFSTFSVRVHDHI